MSNSSLVAYTKISPNRTSPRKHSVDRITPHCVVGQLSAESICGCFTSPSRKASCNYGIGTDGRVALCVEEKDRSWCSSNADNDNRAITIECASDKTHPYAFNDKVYDSLIRLCADVCKRNNKTKLLWIEDKNRALSYQPAEDEMLLTVHRWFAKKACPGDWLMARMGELAAKVTVLLSSSSVTGTQASDYLNVSDDVLIPKLGPLFTEDQKKTGILASVSFAQLLLEAQHLKSELAQNANNCFGMKTSLSGNSWAGSVWDGQKYTKITSEWRNDHYEKVTADFRKYLSIELSIADHSAYLAGAMNGSKKRYDGLVGCTDPQTALEIIKKGGYATSPNYVANLMNVINQYKLTQFDVRSDKAPFIVKVDTPSLNIRTGPGTNYAITGKCTGIGKFTIVEVQNGKGSKSGWGKLKSGAGWISLDYAKRIS